MRHGLWLGMGLLMMVAGRPALADEAGKLTLTTKKLIVFKDGYCLVIKKAVGTTDAEGLLHTEQVPDRAVLGTVWATPTEGELVSMKAGSIKAKTNTEQAVVCSRLDEVFEANRGKAASLLLADGTVQQGTIKKVLGGSGSQVILGTPVGDVLLHVSQVKQLTIKKMATTYKRKVETTKPVKRLTFRFRKPGVKREMSLIYFRPGMRWIPTYRVDLSKTGGKKLAQIAMQAEIINEVEDLTQVPIDLVVGVPNFRFKQVPSPLVLERTLRSALRRAAPHLTTQNFTNTAMSNDRAGWGDRAALVGRRPVELPRELTATGRQDLFMYHLPALSFKKGERIAVPVFRTQAAYKDEYTWDVGLSRSSGLITASAGSPLKITRNNIWHQIRLKNATKFPWTTGAAMIMEGGQPIAQELLAYTSAGSTVRVPLTIAVDTRGQYREQETGRAPKFAKRNGRHYSKIDMGGTLELRNHKATSIDLQIVVRVGGLAEEASSGGDIRVGSHQRSGWVSRSGISAVNQHSDVTWKLTLKPGESRKLTLKYYFFARD